MSRSIGVLKDAIMDLLDNSAVPVGEAGDRHLTTTFRQRADGHELDRNAFLDQISTIRNFVSAVHIAVLNELTDGDSYAERHVITLTDHQGAVSVNEVFVFAVRSEDGRFDRIDEVSVPIKPPQAT